MNSLANKIVGLLPDLERRGMVYLFALVEREDVNLWDVVISSEWSDRDEVSAVREVANALAGRLEPGELSMLSRIAIIPSNAPDIQTMPWSVENISPEDEKVISVPFLGLEVRRVLIFRSQRPVGISRANVETLALGAV